MAEGFATGIEGNCHVRRRKRTHNLREDAPESVHGVYGPTVGGREIGNRVERAVGKRMTIEEQEPLFIRLLWPLKKLLIGTHDP